MFIPPYYALSNEIAEKSDISIANFSMLRKNMEDNNIADVIIKYGNCTFVNTRSHLLPNYLKKAVQYEYTKMDDLLLVSYITTEYECSKEEFIKAFQDTGFESIEEVKISGKIFLKVSEDFINLLKNKIITNISKVETDNCLRDKDIDGAMQLSKDNYLVWYSK